MSSLTRQIRKNQRRLRARRDRQPSSFINPAASRHSAAPEMLTACAIIRGGETFSFAFKSHAQIRDRLGDPEPYETRPRPHDTEGFITSAGRFVDRQQAKIVGEMAGQVQPMTRELLSSDVNWSAGR